jgi:hypothetical protein
MLPRLSRILIAATLALAVPIQGAAAATAGLCMALGHHGAGAASSHDHATDHGAHHHAHGVDSGADHRHAHEVSDNSSDGAHCPPCVACCAAAAISPFAGVFIPERPGASVTDAPDLFLSGIQPERLDRPPLAL